MMGKNEIIERLEEIAKHAVHTIGEEPFIMSIDDGIAIHEAIEIIQQLQSYHTGHWISVFDEDEDKCSECQATFFCAMTRFNFCPNCGADMRKIK